MFQKKTEVQYRDDASWHGWKSVDRLMGCGPSNKNALERC